MALTATPLTDQRVAPHRFLGQGRWEMGVYGADGRVFGPSLLHRSYARGNRFCLGVEAAPEGTPALHLRRAIYGGMLVDHFGHFLTESLARLWYAAQEPEVPILLTLPRRVTRPRLEPWQAEALDLLGLRERVIPLTQLARIDAILVPPRVTRSSSPLPPNRPAFWAAFPGARCRGASCGCRARGSPGPIRRRRRPSTRPCGATDGRCCTQKN